MRVVSFPTGVIYRDTALLVSLSRYSCDNVQRLHNSTWCHLSLKWKRILWCGSPRMGIVNFHRETRVGTLIRRKMCCWETTPWCMTNQKCALYTLSVNRWQSVSFGRLVTEKNMIKQRSIGEIQHLIAAFYGVVKSIIRDIPSPSDSWKEVCAVNVIVAASLIWQRPWNRMFTGADILSNSLLPSTLPSSPLTINTSIQPRSPTTMLQAALPVFLALPMSPVAHCTQSKS